MIIIYAYL